MSVKDAARRLVEQRGGHRVISLYLDLDPERFATPPARSTQIQSLTDEAARAIERDESLDHESLVALREDIARVRRYLLSLDPPYKGSRGLAVFCSGQDDLFEVVQLSHPVEGRVVIERRPYVEPLIAGGPSERWCVALVSRRDARILLGEPGELAERRRLEEDVHGQHDQGGFSQARYQRSVDRDADNHLRHVGEELFRLCQREGFDRLALGGPQEVVARLEDLIADELRSRLVPDRIEVDLGNVGDDEIDAAMGRLVTLTGQQRERQALERLTEGVATEGRGAGGPEATLRALNERRVEKLLLDAGADGQGGRCPTCGLLTLQQVGSCPADGTALEQIEHLREAMIEAALMQDAEVLVVQDQPELGAHNGMAALLRF